LPRTLAFSALPCPEAYISLLSFSRRYYGVTHPEKDNQRKVPEKKCHHEFSQIKTGSIFGN
jgi:hypothetical protein